MAPLLIRVRAIQIQKPEISAHTYLKLDNILVVGFLVTLAEN